MSSLYSFACASATTKSIDDMVFPSTFPSSTTIQNTVCAPDSVEGAENGASFYHFQSTSGTLMC